MTSAATATPTNGDIETLLGYQWSRIESADPQWFNRKGEHRQWRTCRDYLNDLGTLDEAEAYCRERGWNLTIEFAPNDATPVEVYVDPDPEQMGVSVVAAFGHSLIGTAWTAIYRAAEAVKA